MRTDLQNRIRACTKLQDFLNLFGAAYGSLQADDLTAAWHGLTDFHPEGDPKFEYHVEFGGGRGPNVWDNNMKVHAHDLGEAYRLAMLEVSKVSGHIFSIEQED